MTDTGEAFVLWGPGDPQGDISTDNEHPLYSNPHTFNQTHDVYQHSYDLHTEQYHGQASGNNFWLPLSPNPNMQGPAPLPLHNGMSGPGRSSFHTAPPHPI